MKAFLAGAVDFVSAEDATGWRRRAKERLTEAGFDVYDPTADQDLTRPVESYGKVECQQIRNCNHNWVARNGENAILLVNVTRAGSGTGGEMCEWHRWFGPDRMVGFGAAGVDAKAVIDADKLFATEGEATDYIIARWGK